MGLVRSPEDVMKHSSHPLRSSGDPLLAFAESIDNPSILNIELAAISRALKMGLASIWIS